MKHTKGQWKIWGDRGNLISAGDNKGMIAEIINHDVPKFRRPKKEIEANAYLIAAAPELLEALKMATIYIADHCSQNIEENHDKINITKRLLQALTKAEEGI